MKKFDRDLGILLKRLNKSADEETKKKLYRLKDRLIRLNEENVVKINHSVMELVCAKHLILKGYEVDVERPLEGGVICDLYGVKGFGSLIVEVETGFVPPEHALDPATYCKARIASKITRYGNHSEKFALGVPPYYILQIPPALTKPPRDRKSEELREIKSSCDLYYKNPPVSLDEIRNARLHTVYVIDVDGVTVREVDPSTYVENKVRFGNYVT
ncbi:MAG: hypothetical protein OEZ12_06360 [Candidatus Bathyarchaeota archaeon]|nr:hypothetical protein [Candidatus Bathyarchaeota archaeon]